MARVLWVNRCRKPGALVADPDSVFLSSTSRKSSPLKVSRGKNPSPIHIHGVQSPVHQEEVAGDDRLEVLWEGPTGGDRTGVL